MHNVILFNSAGIRTVLQATSVEEAHGAVGPKWPVVFDGAVGVFDSTTDTSGKSHARFVDNTPEDFRHFKFDHLPEHLQNVSKQFYLVAEWIVLNLPQNGQCALALQDLLRAKDAAVRARLAR